MLTRHECLPDVDDLLDVRTLLMAGVQTQTKAAAKFAEEHVDWEKLESCADHLHVGGLFSIPSLQRQLGGRIAGIRT